MESVRAAGQLQMHHRDRQGGLKRRCRSRCPTGPLQTTASAATSAAPVLRSLVGRDLMAPPTGDAVLHRRCYVVPPSPMLE